MDNCTKCTSHPNNSTTENNLERFKLFDLCNRQSSNIDQPPRGRYRRPRSTQFISLHPQVQERKKRLLIIAQDSRRFQRNSENI